MLGMKKFLSISLFVLILVSIGALALVQSSVRTKKLSQLATNCSTASSSDFASERAHGVILRDRTIVSVRLEGEKNFSPPGGHLEVDETPQQALMRELKEEISITTDKKTFKPYRTYCEVLGSTKTQRTTVYFVDQWEGILQVNNKDQLKWVNYEYRLDPDADTELVKVLDYLKADNLID